MKKLISLILLSIMINLSYSQKHQNSIEFGSEKNSQINSINVLNGKVLVLKSNLEVKGDNYITSVDISILDKDLNEKLNKKNAIIYRHSKEQILDKIKNSNSILPFSKTYSISPDGKYIFFIDQANNGDFKRLNLMNGEVQIKSLEKSSEKDIHEIKCSIDNENFYIVKTYKAEKQKDKNEFEIFTVNQNSLNITKTEGITPSVKGSLKVGKFEYWKLIGIDKKGLFMTTNLSIKDKTKNRVVRRVIKFDLNGELIIDKYLNFGIKVLHPSHAGDLHYNEFGFGHFYTFSMHKDQEGKKLMFSEYNSNLELLWSENYATKVIPAQEDFLSEMFKYDNHGVTMFLHQFDGDKYYSLTIDGTNKTFIEFNKEDKKDYNSNLYHRYGVSITDYYLIKNNNEVLNYLKLMTKKHKEGIKAEVNIVGNKIYVSITPMRNLMGMQKSLFFEIAEFEK